ncbi:MAG: transporter substrate-binding domain-containing protein [Alphaproteobacteria bacterium]|nr:transporter substrate-binding domain-containing protein [Alphaproteobacteria bacterium]
MIRKIRSYALVCTLSSILFTALAYGRGDVKEIITQDESLWLAKNQSRIVLAVETSYAPFVFIDSSGQPAGLAHDYVLMLESKLGAHFAQRRFSSLDDIFVKVRAGEVQIVNAVTKTSSRLTFLNMTESFISVPNVIIVRKDRSGPMREENLSGLTVSLVKSYAVTENLTNKGLGLKPEFVPDDRTALLNVSFGRSDAAVIDLATASYLITQNGIANLRVAGEVAFDIQLSMAAPKDEPILFSILQKGLGAITETERQEIHKRWINTSSQSLLTDQRFWIIVGGAIIVVARMLTGRQCKIACQLRVGFNS